MTVTRSNILTNEYARDQYVKGVKLLKDDFLHPNWPSTYDIFVIWHFDAMMTMTPPDGSGGGRNAAHTGPVFLPWHRWMLMLLEHHLQRVLEDPDFGLPYWNWAADGDLPEEQQYSSPIWDNETMGGTGIPVRTGPFAEGLWTVNFRQTLIQEGNERRIVLSPVNSPLFRDFGNSGLRRLPTSGEVKIAIYRNSSNNLYDTEPWNRDSVGFRNEIEGWLGAPPSKLHNAVHVWIGQDMIWGSSPNDPIFYLNHCNVDRIWTGWQQIHNNPEYLPRADADPQLQPHRLNDSMRPITLDVLFDPIFRGSVKPSDLLNVSECYSYDTLKF